MKKRENYQWFMVLYALVICFSFYSPTIVGIVGGSTGLFIMVIASIWEMRKK